jgi:nicotinate-nucleotide adenylyltransferase
MNVGLFFGSFNPVHQGHLIIVNHVLNETGLKKIWFVVSPQNPFKTESGLLDAYNRLHLVRLAVEDDSRLIASDVEFHLPRPSFTSNTLAYLEEKKPNHTFTILMGSDSFQNVHKWKNFEMIVNNYEICVYKRPGFDVLNSKIDTTPTIIESPLIQISATAIRKMVKEKKSIRYLVPDKVREEIERGGYYRK